MFLFADSANGYSSDSDPARRWTLTNTNRIDALSSSGRFGDGCIRVDGPALYWAFAQNIPARGVSGSNELFVGVTFRLTAVPGTATLLFAMANNRFLDGSLTSFNEYDTQLNVTITPDAKIEINRGGTVLDTGDTVLSVGPWYRLEARVVVDNSSGIFQVRLNEALECDYSGDTYTSGAAEINNVVFGGRYWMAQDFLIWDDQAGQGPTSWLGDLRMTTLTPNSTSEGDGVVVGAASSHAAAASLSSSSYTALAAAADRDLYGFTDLLDDPTSIMGIVVTSMTETQGTTGRTGRVVIKSGVNEEVGPTRDIASGYAFMSQAFFDEDPLDAAWGFTTINSLEAGFEVVA